MENLKKKTILLMYNQNKKLYIFKIYNLMSL